MWKSDRALRNTRMSNDENEKRHALYLDLLAAAPVRCIVSHRILYHFELFGCHGHSRSAETKSNSPSRSQTALPNTIFCMTRQTGTHFGCAASRRRILAPMSRLICRSAEVPNRFILSHVIRHANSSKWYSTPSSKHITLCPLLIPRSSAAELN